MKKMEGAMAGFDDKANAFMGDGGDPVMTDKQTMDALQVLEGLHECQIAEKASAIEALSALAGAGQEFEMPNKYRVLDENGKNVFFIVESTDFCTRQLKGSCNDCAAWNVEMRVVNGNNEAEPAFKLSRPWTMTCCCFNRPTMTISDMQDNDIVEIKDPFNCFDLTFNIMVDGEDAMHIKGGCCQPGLCCPLPCGPCSEVHFTAEDMDGNEVGTITKKVPSCIKFLASPDSDNYEVDFADMTDPAMKLALMAVSVFIDFRWFSQNENANSE